MDVQILANSFMRLNISELSWVFPCVEAQPLLLEKIILEKIKDRQFEDRKLYII